MKNSVPVALAAGALLALAFLLAPGSAEACAVCFQAKTDASRIAFIASTAGMTALPLLLVGGVTWWLRKRFRAASEAAAARVGAASPARAAVLSRS